MVNGEKPESFPLGSGTKQGYPFSPLLFSIILGVLINMVREENKIKGIRIGKKNIKLFLFTDDMIIYVENLKQSQKNSWN